MVTIFIDHSVTCKLMIHISMCQQEEHYHQSDYVSVCGVTINPGCKITTWQGTFSREKQYLLGHIYTEKMSGWSFRQKKWLLENCWFKSKNSINFNTIFRQLCLCLCISWQCFSPHFKVILHTVNLYRFIMGCYGNSTAYMQWLCTRVKQVNMMPWCYKYFPSRLLNMLSALYLSRRCGAMSQVRINLV